MESTLFTDLLDCDENLVWTNESYLDFGQVSAEEAGVSQYAVSCKEAGSLYRFFDRPVSGGRYIMSNRCFDMAMNDLSKRRPEHAGAFFGPICCPQLITCYRSFDPNGTPLTFTVNGAEVMRLMESLKPRRLELKAFVHSHPPGIFELSYGDRMYVKKLLANPKNSDDQIIMPIVCEGMFFPYAVDRDGNVTRPEFKTFDCGA